MSVVLDASDQHWFGEGEIPNCCQCDDKLTYPFLHWHGTPIVLCADCCQRIKRGFVADLIHVCAIKELQDSGYGDHTFVRESVKSRRRLAATERGSPLREVK